MGSDTVAMSNISRVAQNRRLLPSFIPRNQVIQALAAQLEGEEIDDGGIGEHNHPDFFGKTEEIHEVA